MAVLYSSRSLPEGDLKGELLKRDPTLDYRIWPDTGAVEDIEFAFVWNPEPGDLARYPNLKVIFNLGAGVEKLLLDKSIPAHVPIVRLVDRALTACMTEYVVMHVLRHHRRQVDIEANQRARKWDPFEMPPAWERKVGVLGHGVLGGDAAEKLVHIGFDLAGWSRHAKTQAGVVSYHGWDQLPAFLARSEILVCLLPLTADTAGILDAKRLAMLPRGASVINAARGGHVVDKDLLAALDSGHIAQATLDVFHQEPLPADHPYWAHPRVTVTPHNASLTYDASVAPGLLAAMADLKAGRPLANVVDRGRGY